MKKNRPVVEYEVIYLRPETKKRLVIEMPVVLVKKYNVSRVPVSADELVNKILDILEGKA